MLEENFAPRYLLIKELGTKNIIEVEFPTSLAAWEASARLWCSWVLFQIDGPGVAPVELGKGGISFAHEACRAHARKQYGSAPPPGPSAAPPAFPTDHPGDHERNKRNRAAASMASHLSETFESLSGIFSSMNMGLRDQLPSVGGASIASIGDEAVGDAAAASGSVVRASGASGASGMVDGSVSSSMLEAVLNDPELQSALGPTSPTQRSDGLATMADWAAVAGLDAEVVVEDLQPLVNPSGNAHAELHPRHTPPEGEGGDTGGGASSFTRLHACRNCQASKTACDNGRPCKRCLRLGIPCDEGKALRRACTACKKSKVKCARTRLSPRPPQTVPRMRMRMLIRRMRVRAVCVCVCAAIR